MQPLSFHKPRGPSLVVLHVCLPLAAAITAALLLMVSQSGARSESGAVVTTTPSTCSTLVQNGSFEMLSGIYPSNWGTPDLPDVEFSRDDHNAHSGTGSGRISSPTDAYFEQEVSVEPETRYLLTDVTNNEDQTSTCQQVVTGNDDEAPVFVNTPPPVSVTTGPEATSCGAVIEDSLLGVTGANPNPVVRDSIVDLPTRAYPNDVVSMSATYDRDSLTFTVNFAAKIIPPSSGYPSAIFGYIDIDTDQNPATGWGSNLDFIDYVSTKLGVDFQIDLLSEYMHPGFVEIRAVPPVVGSITTTVPIVFTSTSFSITVPLAMLGDDGLVNYGVAIFSIYSGDRVPNGAEPATSVNVSEIIAVDNCSDVTISRSGVPPNNIFPVGETLIIYTATDNAGNETSVTQTVTVTDNTLPVISNPVATPSTLWPPNSEMVDVTVSYQVTDNCAILGTKLSVSSNEPDASGTGSDWEVIDAHRIRLRAKRTARQGARLYTITITAEDVHGNVSRENVTVTVPHSHGRTG